LGLRGTRKQVSGENYIMRRFNELYSSPIIVRVIKSRRMRWGWGGTYGGGERCVQGFGGKICGKETTGETKA